MSRPAAWRLGGTLIAAALAAALLSGCDQYWRESGVWDIGEHRGVLLDVSNYYHRHAMEENGRCKSPYIDAVTGAAVSDIEDGVFEVHLHYAYRDFLNDGDDDCDPKRRWLRCTIMRECHGYAARDFLVAKTGDTSFDILDMSGLRNNRR